MVDEVSIVPADDEPSAVREQGYGYEIPPQPWVLGEWPVDLGVWDIAYGNGVFVAVGFPGVGVVAPILTSEDGLNWVERTPPGLLPRLSKVTFANGRFVASGWQNLGFTNNGNYIIWSDDGVNWTRSPTVTNLHGWLATGIAYGGGQYVTVAPRGRRAYSPTGEFWQYAPEVPSSSSFANTPDITYAGDRFYMVGTNLGDARIYESLNGVSNWSFRAAPLALITAHPFLGNLHLGGVGGWTVDDGGVTPVQEVLPGNPSVSYFFEVSGRLVALAAGGLIAETLDGETWAEVPQIGVSPPAVYGAAAASPDVIVLVRYSPNGYAIWPTPPVVEEAA